jgi:hypothetical protein
MTPARAGPGRTSGPLPLVGRDEALADVDAALEQARAGRGALVMLTGEAAARAESLGVETVWSWCASDPAAGSFRPWVQVVRELAARHTRAARLVTGDWVRARRDEHARAVRLLRP